MEQVSSKKFKVNKNLSFTKKADFFVVYYNFNFYFFKDYTAGWMQDLLHGKRVFLPKDFIDYLKRESIIL